MRSLTPQQERETLGLETDDDDEADETTAAWEKLHGLERKLMAYGVSRDAIEEATDPCGHNDPWAMITVLEKALAFVQKLKHRVA
jgi:hypothetical protein